MWQLEWGGGSHIDRSHGKKLFHTSALNLLTVTHRPPCVHLLPAALSRSLWARKRLDLWRSIGSGWTLGGLSGRPLVACVLSADLPHGLFFLTGQEGEEGGRREGGSCRLPGAVWLQLALAVSGWASRWQAWSALLALLGRGELRYLEQGNNPSFNFNISKVYSLSVLGVCWELVCSRRALPPPNVGVRTRYSSAVGWQMQQLLYIFLQKTRFCCHGGEKKPNFIWNTVV